MEMIRFVHLTEAMSNVRVSIVMNKIVAAMEHTDEATKILTVESNEPFLVKGSLTEILELINQESSWVE